MNTRSHNNPTSTSTSGHNTTANPVREAASSGFATGMPGSQGGAGASNTTGHNALGHNNHNSHLMDSAGHTSAGPLHGTPGTSHSEHFAHTGGSSHSIPSSTSSPLTTGHHAQVAHPTNEGLHSTTNTSGPHSTSTGGPHSTSTGAHAHTPHATTTSNGPHSISGGTHRTTTGPGFGQDATGVKPSMADKFTGTAETLMGKVTGDSRKVIEGQTRKTEGKEGLQAAKAEGAI